MKTIEDRDASRVLCISDIHAPYHHPQTWEFLLAVKKVYRPTMVVCLGDEVDQHSLSFHSSDPDLPSAGDELEEATLELTILAEIFPVIDFVDSNHGSMVYRKAKHHGIPLKYIKSYKDFLQAPPGWNWHNNVLLKLSDGQDCYFTHGATSNGLKLTQQMGCNTVQGHHHTKFDIAYTSSPTQLNWAMHVGCSIDDRSIAFAYNKTTAIRPIIGHGIIMDGQPHLLPMILDRNGVWNGRVP